MGGAGGDVRRGRGGWLEKERRRGNDQETVRGFWRAEVKME